MEKKKENVIDNFYIMICKSWTYAKMTLEERQRWRESLQRVSTEEAVKGTYEQRWKVLQACYSAFLDGLGYTGAGWRETEDMPF